MACVLFLTRIRSYTTAGFVSEYGREGVRVCMEISNYSTAYKYGYEIRLNPSPLRYTDTHTHMKEDV